MNRQLIRNNSKYLISNNILTIKQVDQNDIDVYECIASNRFGKVHGLFNLNLKNSDEENYEYEIIQDNEEENKDELEYQSIDIDGSKL